MTTETGYGVDGAEDAEYLEIFFDWEIRDLIKTRWCEFLSSSCNLKHNLEEALLFARNADWQASEEAYIRALSELADMKAGLLYYRYPKHYKEILNFVGSFLHEETREISRLVERLE